MTTPVINSISVANPIFRTSVNLAALDGTNGFVIKRKFPEKKWHQSLIQSGLEPDFSDARTGYNIS